MVAQPEKVRKPRASAPEAREAQPRAEPAYAQQLEDAAEPTMNRISRIRIAPRGRQTEGSVSATSSSVDNPFVPVQAPLAAPVVDEASDVAGGRFRRTRINLSNGSSTRGGGEPSNMSPPTVAASASARPATEQATLAAQRRRVSDVRASSGARNGGAVAAARSAPANAGDVLSVEGLSVSTLLQLSHQIANELAVRAGGARVAAPLPIASSASPASVRARSPAASASVPAVLPAALPWPAHSVGEGITRPEDLLPYHLAMSLVELWETVFYPLLPLSRLTRRRISEALGRAHGRPDAAPAMTAGPPLELVACLLLALHASQLSSALPAQRKLAIGRVHTATFESANDEDSQEIDAEEAKHWLDPVWVWLRASASLEAWKRPPKTTVNDVLASLLKVSNRSDVQCSSCMC
jgi:hypothetical protein